MNPVFDWNKFHSYGQPVSYFLKFFFEHFDNFKGDNSGKTAIELGCGVGNDSVYLASEQNMRVISQDFEISSVSKTYADFKSKFPEQANNMEIKKISFEDLSIENPNDANSLLQPNSKDLVYASYSIPFCSNQTFYRLFDKIKSSLKTGGAFCGTLFGDKDSWNNAEHANRTTFLKLEDVAGLFDSTLDLMKRHDNQARTSASTRTVTHWEIANSSYRAFIADVDEPDGICRDGERKHWHTYHINAIKRAGAAQLNTSAQSVK